MPICYWELRTIERAFGQYDTLKRSGKGELKTLIINIIKGLRNNGEEESGG